MLTMIVAFAALALAGWSLHLSYLQVAINQKSVEIVDLQSIINKEMTKGLTELWRMAGEDD